MSYVPHWTDISPTQAGLAAALHRAFATPEDEAAKSFEDLLEKLN